MHQLRRLENTPKSLGALLVCKAQPAMLLADPVTWGQKATRGGLPAPPFCQADCTHRTSQHSWAAEGNFCGKPRSTKAVGRKEGGKRKVIRSSVWRQLAGVCPTTVQLGTYQKQGHLLGFVFVVDLVVLGAKGRMQGKASKVWFHVWEKTLSNVSQNVNSRKTTKYRGT